MNTRRTSRVSAARAFGVAPGELGWWVGGIFTPWAGRISRRPQDPAEPGGERQHLGEVGAAPSRGTHQSMRDGRKGVDGLAITVPGGPRYGP